MWLGSGLGQKWVSDWIKAFSKGQGLGKGVILIGKK